MGTHSQHSHFDSNQFNVDANNNVTLNNLIGTAAPSVTPNFIGQLFIDTTNKNIYAAIGTTGALDWELLNGV